MSWFDKLFGEDNNSDEDYLNKRSQRRQKAVQHEARDSLLPQNNDVYERPKGKFRFPMRVLEEANAQNDVNQSATENQQDYRRDEQSGSINTQHRRHRQMRDKVTNNDKNNQLNEQQKTKPSQHSHLQAHTETKQHKGKRMRIQTDVLRANATSKHHHSTTPKHYHQSEFKASEVPSAIFGTKKPRPLENGVIKRDQDEYNDRDTSNRTQDNTSVKTSQSNYQNKSNQDKAKLQNAQDGDNINGEKSKAQNQTGEVTKQKDISADKNVSDLNVARQNKKDNTIKIENIYASQIVEEIRRERERKVLQKRQFKKALQQKRNENYEHQEDSIQKAIDEMYAKQAHNYIGESSLDDEDYDIESHESPTGHSQLDENHASSEEPISEDTTTGETSLFNYEEIDLNHVHDKHTIDEDRVEVNTDSKNSKHSDDNVTIDSESENNDAISTQTNNTIQNHRENLDASEHQDNHEMPQTFEDGEESDIVDAQYRELSDRKTDSFENNSTEGNDENRDDVELDHINSPSMTAFDHSKDNNEANDNADLDISSRAKDSEVEDVNINNTDSSDSNNETLLSKHEDVSHVEDPSSISKSTNHSMQSEQQKVNAYNIKQKTPSDIKKGSKPFNVLMTPSDKKRMLDAQKSKIKSFNQINQSTGKSSHTDSTQNNDHQLSNHKGQDITTEEQTNNAPELASEKNITRENHGANSQTLHEGQTEPEPAIDAKNEVKDDDLDTSTGRQQADNIQTQQNKQAPLLKPEMTENQLGGNQTLNDQQNNKAIRRGPNIKMPSVELLEAPIQHEIDNAWIEDKKQELNEAFYYFNVPAEVQNVTEGPSVTRFELSVEKGVKVSRITALQDDIKMALAAKDIRIEAPIPGTSLVGIEVPNQNATPVNLRSIIEESAFKNAESKLTVAMGLRINNEPLLMDISKTPHALIAGATGSGKSVCINSILMSLLYKNHPEELRLLLIDPKMVELAPYNDLPHLVAPVITDVKAATQSLKWAVEEMERRYKVFAKYHVRNITAFNKKASYEDRMPKIVIVIDELADLMMMAPQEVEQSIARIAQKARACGIHMLVATQRPSVNVITGLIKANIPTRIAFMVSSSVDSRTILDSGGAERLLGYGDMLYLGSGMNKPIRVQGTFVSDEEIDDVVDFIKQQRAPEYLFEEKELLKKTEAQPQDDLFDDVCRFMLNEGHISTSLVQRHFQIGYNRAARIVDQLEQLGYVSGANGSKPRDVYITEADLNEN